MRRLTPGKVIVGLAALYAALCALAWWRNGLKGLKVLLALLLATIIVIGIISSGFLIRGCFQFENDPEAYNNLLEVRLTLYHTQEVNDAYKELDERGFPFAQYGIVIPPGPGAYTRPAVPK